MSENELYNGYIDEVAVVSKTDKSGNILYINPLFCKISGYSKDELIGNNHKIVRSPSISKEFFKNLWTTILSGNNWHGIIKNQSKNGEEYYINSTIFPIFDENREIKEFMNIGFVVTEEEQVISKLKKYIMNQKSEKIQHVKEIHSSFDIKVKEAIREEILKNEKMKELVLDMEKDLNEFRSKSHSLAKQNSLLHEKIKEVETTLLSERKRNKEILQSISVERTELLKKVDNSTKYMKTMEEKLKKSQEGIVVFQGYIDEYRKKIDDLNDVIVNYEKELGELKKGSST